MNQKQITIGKRIIEIYWVSVLAAVIFFFDSSFGYYYALVGGFFLIVHCLEILLVVKTILQFSNNSIRDILLVIPYGLLIPTELKLSSREN